MSKAGHCENNGILLISLFSSLVSVNCNISHSHGRMNEKRNEEKKSLQICSESQKCPKGYYNPPLEKKKLKYVGISFLPLVYFFRLDKGKEF